MSNISSQTSEQSPTSVSQPPSILYQPHVVKIELGCSQATITNEKQTFTMYEAVERVKKRFFPGETVAFFRSSIKEGVGVLEIHERMPRNYKGW